jgi:hypothetical protein
MFPESRYSIGCHSEGATRTKLEFLKPRQPNNLRFKPARYLSFKLTPIGGGRTRSEAFRALHVVNQTIRIPAFAGMTPKGLLAGFAQFVFK